MRKIFLLFLFMGVSIYAVDVSMTLVSSAFPNSHKGLAVDPITGKVYVKEYHANNYVTIYDDVNKFAQGVSSSRIALGTSLSGGTYIAAYNDKIYARTDTSTSSVSRYSSTGVLEASNTISGMSGGNNGFAWGGYTNENFFYDGLNLYVLGRDSSNNNYQISKLSSNLTVLESKTVNTGGAYLGYAFIINGLLFTGTDYGGNTISKVFNFATGTYTTVNYTFTNMPGGYRTNISYDAMHDALYVSDYSSGIFKLNNASVVFNTGLPVVPEPSNILLAILGFLFVYMRCKFN